MNCRNQIANSTNRAEKNRCWLRSLVPCILLLTACTVDADPPEQDVSASDGQPVAIGRPGKAYVYECGGDFKFTARIEGETAWLFLPSGTVSLPHVPAASGAKYSDGVTTFWSKGEDASLERPDQARAQCTNNRAEAIWEDAKLRGADFRATGNEPGWDMEISRSYGIVLVTNYGADRYQFAPTEPLSDAASRTTKYEAKEGGHELVISLEGKRCVDTMSGAQFETTVTVIIDNRQLNGCGKALH